MKELDAFNAMVRRWADEQPARYRLSALAFGYPCNRETHSFDQTLQWVVDRARKRGEGISLRKLKADLLVFRASGVITVERRRNGSFNMSSVYRIDFGKTIDETIEVPKSQRRTEDDEHQRWLASLGDDAPDIKHHDRAVAPALCAACKPLIMMVYRGEMSKDQVHDAHESG